jgi:hypothetical protein
LQLFLRVAAPRYDCCTAGCSIFPYTPLRPQPLREHTVAHRHIAMLSSHIAHSRRCFFSRRAGLRLRVLRTHIVIVLPMSEDALDDVCNRDLVFRGGWQ